MEALNSKKTQLAELAQPVKIKFKIASGLAAYELEKAKRRYAARYDYDTGAIEFLFLTKEDVEAAPLKHLKVILAHELGHQEQHKEKVLPFTEILISPFGALLEPDAWRRGEKYARKWDIVENYKKDFERAFEKPYEEVDAMARRWLDKLYELFGPPPKQKYPRLKFHV